MVVKTRGRMRSESEQGLGCPTRYLVGKTVFKGNDSTEETELVQDLSCQGWKLAGEEVKQKFCHRDPARVNHIKSFYASTYQKNSGIKRDQFKAFSAQQRQKTVVDIFTIGLIFFCEWNQTSHVATLQSAILRPQIYNHCYRFQLIFLC
jgi:hypothetical protein